MRQRLGIAGALLRAPELLLLDEPTSGMDPAGVRDLLALVHELARRDGVAVVLSSHQMDEVEGVCDSFTVLRRGRVVWDGSAAGLRAQAPVPAYRLATIDDRRALQLAPTIPGLRAQAGLSGGIEVIATDALLDRYVRTLVQEGVAVRRLELTVSSLASMFFALTEDAHTPADGTSNSTGSPVGRA